jgi:hypothetical protein
MQSLKILHISDGSLPDWRIEKSALSVKKKNPDNQVFFAGLPIKRFYNFTFDKYYTLPWDYQARYHEIVSWIKLKTQLAGIVDDCKPDIIHAHDIFAAQLVKESELNIPWIYDNHEYWSRYVIYQYLQNDYFKQKNPQHHNIPNLWRKWDLDLINDKEIPIITPSKVVAQELSYFNRQANIFLVPNYPSYEEIKDVPDVKEPDKCNIQSVFTSRNKPYPGKILPFQNIDGFFDLFNTGDLGQLNTIGWNDISGNFIHHNGPVPHDKMYTLLTNYELGIIPWKHHPFHQYCSPNRAFEYAHAGLILIIPKSLETVFNDMCEMAVTFKTYDDIKEAIHYYQDNLAHLLEDRIKSQLIARKNLLWENYESNIFDAYNKTL